MWIDPVGQSNMSFPNQRCGGSLASNGTQLPFVQSGGAVFADETPKGFICPSGQLCIEIDNPNAGTTSFDNIFAAALQVVVVISINTWSPVMYETMDADFFVSCFYFLVTIIILTFWCIGAAWWLS